MKLEATLSYGDNVLFCVFEVDEDCSEAVVTAKLTGLGYQAWGVAPEDGIAEAVKACEEEGNKEIVLAPLNWDPKSGIMPLEYTLFVK